MSTLLLTLGNLLWYLAAMWAMVREECGWLREAFASPWAYLPPVLALLAALVLGKEVGIAGWWALMAWLLALVALVDLRRMMVPHLLNFALFVLGLVAAFGLGAMPWWHAVVAPLVYGGLLYVAGVVASRLAGQPALGLGDVWLVAAMAPWLGLANLPPFLLLLALLGGVYGVVRFFARKVRPARFAFAPLLALAGWLALAYGEYYWQIIRFLKG